MRIIGSGGGGKSGGGGGGGISEDPDNLSSVALVRFIDLLGEGPIQGLVRGEYSIYLDGVPLKSPDGTSNFGSIKYDKREGTQTQSPMPGFVGTQSENSVNLKILKTQGKVIRTIADSDADSCRFTLSVNGLTNTDATGKISGASVSFILWKRVSGGTWVKGFEGAIEGKTTSRYQRSMELTLSDLGAGPYDVAVERVTNDAGSGLVVDGLFWDSFTVINYEKFTYPNSALVGVEIDGRNFSSVPNRTYHVRGMLVQVPKNYDPVKRTYATTGPGTTNGAWDGTFKVAYTNNPAWCFYDLAVSRRYGVGNYIIDKVYSGPGVFTEVPRIDKWALYEISKYCDGLVPTGLSTNTVSPVSGSTVSTSGRANANVPIMQGPMEPRFTLNCVINTREQANKVLNQLASTFRGMSYWGSNSVTLTQDRPTTPSMLYSNANVIDGLFAYESSGRETRYSAVVVGWNDPAENFVQKFEYVEDRLSMARFGVKVQEVVAFGCTSRSQARRYGLWLLLTQRLEQEMVKFRVGLDSAFVRPGHVVKILDSDYAGVRWGGRLISFTSTSVTIDAALTLTAGSYKLTIILKDGTLVERNLTLTSGTRSVFTISALTVLPTPGAMWILESTTVVPRLARVVSVRRDASTYEIAAIEHNPSKFAAVETGANIEQYSYSAISYNQVPQVMNLVAVENSYKSINSRDFVSQIDISWDLLSDPTVRGYRVQIVGADKSVVDIPETSKGRYTYEAPTPQQYTVTVWAVNVLGRPGPQSSSTVTVVGQDDRTPTAPAVPSLTTSFSAFELSWTQPTYSEGGGHESMEVYVNSSNNSSTASRVGTTSATRFSYPAVLGVERFFWIKSVAKNKKASAFSSVVSGTLSRVAGDDILDGAIIPSKLDVQIGSGNVVPNSSFEADSNSDGLADGWSAVSTDGARVNQTTRVAALLGTGFAQRVQITAATPSSTSHTAITRSLVGVVKQGETWILSAYVRTNAAGKVRTLLRWLDGSGAQVGTDSQSQMAVGDQSIQRLSCTGVVPSGAVTAAIQVRGTTAVGEWFEVDAVQLQSGNLLTGWSPLMEVLPGQITETMIYPGSITTPLLAANSVTAAIIQAGLFMGDNVVTRGLTVRKADGTIILGAGTALAMDHVPAGANNSNISINSNGQLTGAGGGQVTITGLGFLGSLSATAKAPSLGIRINSTTFGNTSGGEAYLHGYDKDGNPADVDGFVFYAGAKYTVPKGYLINPDQVGSFFVLFDTAGRNLWPNVAGTANSASVVTAQKVGSSWTYYVAGQTGSVTVDFQMIVIGEVSLNAAENINSGATWMDALSPFTIPEQGATVGAPAGTFVNGVPAATVATAVTNFNSANDRNASAIAAPTVLTDGTAVDHTLQGNGSADVSFEWVWSGDEGDIDGFQVFVRQSTSSAAYTFGTTAAEEVVYELPAAKRAFILYGLIPNRYYTFGVRAYRRVDKDVAPGGIIVSTLVKATASGENPYRPSSTVAFTGNVTGTVNGIAAANVNVWTSISGTGKPENNATVGAQAGTNLKDSSGNVIGDLAFLNRYSVGENLAGDLTGNPFMTKVDPGRDRPWGIKSTFSNVDPSFISYVDTGRSALRLKDPTNTDTAIGAGWPAFRITPNMRYRVFLRWRTVGATLSGSGLYFRFVTKRAEIAQGKTHIGWEYGESVVDVGAALPYVSGSATCKVISDTNGVSVGLTYENRGVTANDTWYETVLEFTPNNADVWASFTALNWTGLGASASLDIDTCFIYAVTTAADGATVGATLGPGGNVNGSFDQASFDVVMNGQTLIRSLHIQDLRTTNYVEDGTGKPTSGAKLASTGTAFKVASGSFQVGGVLFTDYWFRLLQAIDGDLSAGKVVWRGNVDTTIRGGAPNINALTLYGEGGDEPAAGAVFLGFNWRILPTGSDDNLDGLRYIKLEIYRADDTAPFTTRYVSCSDRLYANTTDTNSENASFGSCLFSIRTSTGSGYLYHPSSPYSFYGHIRASLYNSYGPSATRWYHGSSGFGGTAATANVRGITLIADNTAPTGAPPAGGGGGGGSYGGYCPAPWVKIMLHGGREIPASQLTNGMKLAAVNDMTFEEISAGGTVRNVKTIWAERIRLKLTDGRTSEWSYNHRVYVVGVGWSRIQDLKPGQLLAAQIESVVESVISVGEGQVVSFTVEGAGTYFGDGFLNHNVKTNLP